MLYFAVCCVQLCYLCRGLCWTYGKDNVLPKKAGNEFQGEREACPQPGAARLDGLPGCSPP